MFCTEDFDEVNDVKAHIEGDYDSDDLDRETKVDAEMLKWDFSDRFKVQSWDTFCE